MTESIAYYGTYTVNEGERVAILHLEASTFPNQIGTDQKLTITSLTADELKYSNPAAKSGVQVHQVWKRAELAVPAGALVVKVMIMDEPNSNPGFEAHRLMSASGWYVRVAWPNGKHDHIPGFVSHQEAHRWIEGKAQAWLSERCNAAPFHLAVSRPHLSSPSAQGHWN